MLLPGDASRAAVDALTRDLPYPTTRTVTARRAYALSGTDILHRAYAHLLRDVQH